MFYFHQHQRRLQEPQEAGKNSSRLLDQFHSPILSYFVNENFARSFGPLPVGWNNSSHVGCGDSRRWGSGRGCGLLFSGRITSRLGRVRNVDVCNRHGSGEQVRGLGRGVFVSGRELGQGKLPLPWASRRVWRVWAPTVLRTRNDVRKKESEAWEIRLTCSVVPTVSLLKSKIVELKTNWCVPSGTERVETKGVSRRLGVKT